MSAPPCRWLPFVVSVALHAVVIVVAIVLRNAYTSRAELGGLSVTIAGGESAIETRTERVLDLPDVLEDDVLEDVLLEEIDFTLAPPEEVVEEPQSLPDDASATEGPDATTRVESPSPRLLDRRTKPPRPPVVRMTPVATPSPVAPTTPATAVRPRAPVRAASPLRAGHGAVERPVARSDNLPPAYPPELWGAHVEGWVLLRVRIEVDGTVAGAEISSSSGERAFEEAARRAVLAWTFEPARRGGRPVRSIMEVPIRFRLAG